MTDPIRMLVVDDEPAIAGLLEVAANQHGWKATKALSAAEAAELIQGESFQIYIVDKNLPDGSGVLFLRSGPRSFDGTLYVFDVASGEERQVSHGLMASSPPCHCWMTGGSRVG